MEANSYSTIEHLIDIKRFPQARSEVEKRLQSEPNNTQLLFYSAQIHWMNDENIEGIEVAEVGLSYAPNDEGLRYLLFELLKDESRYQEAELIIIELIKSNPRDDDYLRGYSELMLFTFHLKKAKALILEALRISPDDVSNIHIATLIDIVDGNLEHSEQKIQKLIADDPDNQHILFLLLVQLIEKKKTKEALILAQELLRSDPQNNYLIDIIVDLRSTTHWSAIPLWPINRFGWIASIGLWFIFVILLKAESHYNISWLSYITWIYLGWCIYTWLHNPIYKRISEWKGI